jgi:hypothetical protein
MNRKSASIALGEEIQRISWYGMVIRRITIGESNQVRSEVFRDAQG